MSGCREPNDVSSPEPALERSPPTSGTVSGTAPRASGGFPSVVILEPVTPSEFPPPNEPVLLDQYNTDFHPRLLVARVGQIVQFKNSEDTLHNVHVIDIETRDTAFNVATPLKGSYEFVFDHEAVYDVSCGIHPSMAAFIVVTQSPFAVAADAQGQFRIDEVPAGRYRVRVWNIDPSRRSERELEVETTPTEWILEDVS